MSALNKSYKKTEGEIAASEDDLDIERMIFFGVATYWTRVRSKSRPLSNPPLKSVDPRSLMVLINCDARSLPPASILVKGSKTSMLESNKTMPI